MYSLSQDPKYDLNNAQKLIISAMMSQVIVPENFKSDCHVL